MNSEDYFRMKQIQEEMLDLLSEAESIIRREKGIEYERAKAYWIPGVRMALTPSSGYLGRNMFTMEDTINALNPDDENEDEIED